MLANFFNSEDFRCSHSVSFSYRQSASYAEGFRRRVKHEMPVYPLAFPDLSKLSFLPGNFPLLGRRLITAMSRLLLAGPILMYEILVLFRLFKKISPDILHINNGGYPAALSARAAAIAGKLAGVPKILMTVNNMAVGYHLFSRWLEYPLDILVGRAVDLFITGSGAAAARLSFVLSLPENRVLAIHNGIAMRKQSAGAVATRQRLGLKKFGGVVFGVVAVMESRKGHQVLLEAIAKLSAENAIRDQDLIILIEGDGHLRQELVDFVYNHGLGHLVSFVGAEGNIVDFMSILDVLILPSIRDEDFPNVILEAMALGKPVIASRLAGTPEQLIEGVTGLLVEAGNVAQLSEAIVYLVNKPCVRNEMGLAALERFNDHFTSEIAIKNYVKMYSQLSVTRG